MTWSTRALARALAGVVAAVALVATGCDASDGADGVDASPTGGAPSGGASSTAVNDDGPHKLSGPETVLGRYRLMSSPSTDGQIGTLDAKRMADVGLVDGTAVDLRYTDFDGPGSGSVGRGSASYLIVQGAYGKISNPAEAIDHFFALLDADAAVGNVKTPVGEPVTQSPNGLSDAVMKCQVMRYASPRKPNEAPMCVWSDNSTIAAIIDAEFSGPSTVESGAPTTLAVRNEIRVAR